jgi:transposase InsO family protein
MLRGFLYLVAIMDWFSRYVLSWRLSNTLEASFCVEALKDALEIGRPEIFNTDRGQANSSSMICRNPAQRLGACCTWTTRRLKFNHDVDETDSGWQMVRRPQSRSHVNFRAERPAPVCRTAK